MAHFTLVQFVNICQTTDVECFYIPDKVHADFPGLAKVLGHFNGKQASDAMLAPLFTFLKATRGVIRDDRDACTVPPGCFITSIALVLRTQDLIDRPRDDLGWTEEPEDEEAMRVFEKSLGDEVFTWQDAMKIMDVKLSCAAEKKMKEYWDASEEHTIVTMQSVVRKWKKDADEMYDKLRDEETALGRDVDSRKTRRYRSAAMPSR